MLSIRASLLLALLGAAVAAHAAPTVIDGSFEDTLAAGGPNSYAYAPSGTAWTYTFPSGLANGSSPWHDAARDGDQYAFVQSASGVGGGIKGTMTGLTVGQAYSLTFYLGTRGGYGINPLDVLVGNAAIATNVAPADARVGTGWAEFVFGFTATATTTDLAFVSSAASPGDLSTTLDNVSVQAVPEPASMAVLAGGALGLLRRRRKSCA